MFFGRRRENRRETDPQANYYIDRYSARAYWAVALVMALCTADGLFTIFHLDRGAKEINPIMDFALSFGTLHFLIVKYAMTAAGLLVLLTHKNFFIARLATVVVTSLYTLLLAYHLYPIALSIIP